MTSILHELDQPSIDPSIMTRDQRIKKAAHDLREKSQRIQRHWPDPEAFEQFVANVVAGRVTGAVAELLTTYSKVEIKERIPFLKRNADAIAAHFGDLYLPHDLLLSRDAIRRDFPPLKPSVAPVAQTPSPVIPSAPATAHASSKSAKPSRPDPKATAHSLLEGDPALQHAFPEGYMRARFLESFTSFADGGNDQIETEVAKVFAGRKPEEWPKAARTACLSGSVKRRFGSPEALLAAYKMRVQK